MPEKYLVVLPTYNESKNIRGLVPRILEQDPSIDILIVDDSSPDGTGDIADEMAAIEPRLKVLHRPNKEGLGRAYLSGFAWALDREYQLIFEMDADFSHDPKYLGDLIAKAGEADVVIGSRYKSGVNVINWPMSRLLLSYFANIYVRIITGMPLTDATGGFKCFNRKVLAAIPLERVKSNGYAFQIEMSMRTRALGFTIEEVSIIFTDRAAGQSKMNKRIVREAVWMVWWLKLQQLFGLL